MSYYKTMFKIIMNVTIPGITCNLVSCIEMDESGPSNRNARNYVVQDDEDEQNEEFLGCRTFIVYDTDT